MEGVLQPENRTGRSAKGFVVSEIAAQDVGSDVTAVLLVPNPKSLSKFNINNTQLWIWMKEKASFRTSRGDKKVKARKLYFVWKEVE